MASSAVHPLGSLQSPEISFGTDGLRGRVGSAITPALALQVGFWCGRVLSQGGPVLIGMDSRSSGSMVVAALTAGLAAAGREVWTLGLCPTPAVPGLIRRFQASGGLMVSASHNPPEDNGIKVFGADGSKLGTELQRRIESGLRGESEAAEAMGACGAASHRPDLLDHYRESLLSSVQHQRLDGVLNLQTFSSILQN